MPKHDLTINVVNFNFLYKQRNNNKYVMIQHTPLKENELENVAPDLRGYIQSLSTVLTRCRQACEWGMGGPCKVYRQLAIPLPVNKDLRQLRLDNIHRLYNYRVRTMNISEIRNHFST